MITVSFLVFLLLFLVIGLLSVKRSRKTRRDYYLASSPGAGLLWVFRARHTGNTSAPAWFLHGLFT